MLAPSYSWLRECKCDQLVSAPRHPKASWYTQTQFVTWFSGAYSRIYRSFFAARNRRRTTRKCPAACYLLHAALLLGAAAVLPGVHIYIYITPEYVPGTVVIVYDTSKYIWYLIRTRYVISLRILTNITTGTYYHGGFAAAGWRPPWLRACP